jgi:hypothetical protein
MPPIVSGGPNCRQRGRARPLGHAASGDRFASFAAQNSSMRDCKSRRARASANMRRAISQTVLLSGTCPPDSARRSRRWTWSALTRAVLIVKRGRLAAGRGVAERSGSTQWTGGPPASTLGRAGVQPSDPPPEGCHAGVPEPRRLCRRSACGRAPHRRRRYIHGRVRRCDTVRAVRRCSKARGRRRTRMCGSNSMTMSGGSRSPGCSGGALPIKLEAPDLNAAGNDVAIKQLTLAYEGLERDDPPDGG